MKTLPTLTTKHLILRPLNENDIGFLFDHYNQEEISRFTLISLKSIDETKVFLDQYIARRDSNQFKMGIELKSTQQLIGTVCFVNWIKNDRCAEIGYDYQRNIGEMAS